MDSLNFTREERVTLQHWESAMREHRLRDAKQYMTLLLTTEHWQAVVMHCLFWTLAMWPIAALRHDERLDSFLRLTKMYEEMLLSETTRFGRQASDTGEPVQQGDDDDDKEDKVVDATQAPRSLSQRIEEFCSLFVCCAAPFSSDKQDEQHSKHWQACASNVHCWLVGNLHEQVDLLRGQFVSPESWNKACAVGDKVESRQWLHSALGLWHVVSNRLPTERRLALWKVLGGIVESRNDDIRASIAARIVKLAERVTYFQSLAFLVVARLCMHDATALIDRQDYKPIGRPLNALIRNWSALPSDDQVDCMIAPFQVALDLQRQSIASSSNDDDDNNNNNNNNDGVAAPEDATKRVRKRKRKRQVSDDSPNRAEQFLATSATSATTIYVPKEATNVVAAEPAPAPAPAGARAATSASQNRKRQREPIDISSDDDDDDNNNTDEDDYEDESTESDGWIEKRSSAVAQKKSRRYVRPIIRPDADTDLDDDDDPGDDDDIDSDSAKEDTAGDSSSNGDNGVQLLSTTSAPESARASSALLIPVQRVEKSSERFVGCVVLQPRPADQPQCFVAFDLVLERRVIVCGPFDDKRQAKSIATVCEWKKKLVGALPQTSALSRSLALVAGPAMLVEARVSDCMRFARVAGPGVYSVYEDDGGDLKTMPFRQVFDLYSKFSHYEPGQELVVDKVRCYDYSLLSDLLKKREKEKAEEGAEQNNDNELLLRCLVISMIVCNCLTGHSQFMPQQIELGGSFRYLDIEHRLATFEPLLAHLHLFWSAESDRDEFVRLLLEFCRTCAPLLSELEQIIGAFEAKVRGDPTLTMAEIRDTRQVVGRLQKFAVAIRSNSSPAFSEIVAGPS